MCSSLLAMNSVKGKTLLTMQCRFSFTGIRTILWTFLTGNLGFSSEQSTMIFHGFITTAFGFSIVGAWLADNILGKYQTILLACLIYMIGSIIVALSSLPFINGTIGIFIGLFLLAIGTSGVKPNIASFGGDQFKAEQKVFLSSFFAMFYFAINAGSFVSSLITPVIKENVSW
jgi:solute carrier family 15 oligopeptide transporter 1